MADRTAIEWTEATWTPVRARSRMTGKVGWHCVHVSEGCRNCYAEGMNRRLGTGLLYKPALVPDQVAVFLDEKMLLAPLRWKRPRMIFVCSMTDLFADFVTDEMIDRIFAVMALCPQHTFQVLTKRSARMRAYFASKTNEQIVFADRLNRDGSIERVETVVDLPLPNVWLGVSAEDQTRADERVPDLLATPAAVRWVSAEPLLGPIDFLESHPYALGRENVVLPPALMEELRSYTPTDQRSDVAAVTALVKLLKAWGFGNEVELGEAVAKLGGRFEHTADGINWIVGGGESGPRARPMLATWARDIRDQCAAAGVPFFFKQWGEWEDADNRREGLQRAGFVFGGKPLSAPLNFADAALVADGDRHEHHSDGSTSIRVGKRRAGRILDGRTHGQMPVPPT